MSYELTSDDFKYPTELEIVQFSRRFARKVAEQLRAEAEAELNAKGLMDSAERLAESFHDYMVDALYEVSSAAFEEREGITPARAQELNKRMATELAKAVKS